MAQFGYFRLEHSSVNRADKGDGYLAASANYAANDNKCAKILHINMAADRYAIRDYIQRHEEGISRKNARLGDKILLSLPTELSDEHRELATARFLWVITGEGRSRAAAFYHADKAHNPHMHVILLDRDVETGQAVAMMGASRSNRMKAGLEPNATEWLRKVWERQCNSVCEEFGYEIVMDRRTNLERGLPEAEEHRGFDNDNAVDHIEPEPSSEPDLEAEPDIDTVDFPEDEDMAAAASIETTALESYEGTPHGFHARELFRTVTELNRKHDAEKRLAEAERRYALATKARENTSIAASAHFIHVEKARQTAYQAKQDLQAHVTGKGKLKGFKLLGFKTPGRKQAEQAQDRAERADVAATYHAKEQEGYDYNAKLAETREQEAEREAYVRRNELLDLYGDAQDLARAEEVMQNTVKAHLHEITKAGTTVEQMAEAMYEGEITSDEFRTYLVQSGQEALLAAYDMGMEDPSEGEAL
ncbi:MobA/MobL family protein [Mesorhizobium sp. ES1-1]|uniref:MobA/MobL family protein n=1 Tax=Mesorhizobium sp. ES1-1 TaxID=2876629 RepID=UPI001CCFF552|nr:MobA/MobL family protein [Mesorhizobium sp. ES1-1]MBZ9674569.1 MobA/MobL family protein [Mesorhizobium sp. ES1-1]